MHEDGFYVLDLFISQHAYKIISGDKVVWPDVTCLVGNGLIALTSVTIKASKCLVLS